MHLLQVQTISLLQKHILSELCQPTHRQLQVTTEKANIYRMRQPMPLMTDCLQTLYQVCQDTVTAVLQIQPTAVYHKYRQEPVQVWIREKSSLRLLFPLPQSGTRHFRTTRTGHTTVQTELSHREWTEAWQQ